MKKFIIPISLLLFYSCQNEPDPISISSQDKSETTEQFNTNGHNYISTSEAIIIATQVLNANNEYSKSRASDKPTNAKVSLLNYPYQNKQDSTFLIVNFENGGAVMVAGDKRVSNKIYAYSLDSNFDPTPNPAQEDYLNWAINDAQMAASDSKDNYYRAPVDPDTPVPAILFIDGIECYGYPNKTVKTEGGEIGIAKWHQLYPYNFFIPNNTSTKFPVGCGAVAMGQIMAHFKKPESYNGHTYNWEEMTSTAKFGSIVQPGAMDVSRLLSELGEPLHMKYSETAAESFIEDAREAFILLGYHADPVSVFSAQECANSLYKKRPVYMRGTTTKNEGHAWIVEYFKQEVTTCDYYRRDNNQFYKTITSTQTDLYMNWGYGGKNDGFYRMPGSIQYDSETIFCKHFKAIYNIYYL